MTQPTGSSRALKTLSIASIAFTLLVILWGAFVRKTHSGAGCGEHWPLCNGVYVPLDPSIETLIEYSHRLSSGIAFLLVLLVFVLAQFQLDRGHPAKRPAFLSLVFMIIEALLGAGLVIFGLVDSNDSYVRAIAVSVHLANTFVLLGFMAQTSLVLTKAKVPPKGVLLKNPVNAFFALLLMVIASFGAVAALGNTLFPAANLAEGMASRLVNDAHFLEKLKVFHPLLAVVGGLSIVAVVQYRMAKKDKTEKKENNSESESLAGSVLSGLIICNIAFGAFDVLLLAPTWLSMIHLFMADLIWISFIWYLFEQPARKENVHLPLLSKSF
jgi:heme A synthase